MAKALYKDNMIQFRPFQIQDAASILEIYSPFILSSAITFELEVPSLDAFQKRLKNISDQYPFFVAEENGKILGYAYANQFRERAAYQWSLESSIYVRESEQTHAKPKTELAKKLYEMLFFELKKRGFKQVIGVITLPNEKSVRFHEKMGFQKIGVFPSVGFKQGAWHDVLFVTRFLEPLPLSNPL